MYRLVVYRRSQTNWRTRWAEDIGQRLKDGSWCRFGLIAFLFRSSGHGFLHKMLTWLTRMWFLLSLFFLNHNYSVVQWCVWWCQSTHEPRQNQAVIVFIEGFKTPKGRAKRGGLLQLQHLSFRRSHDLHLYLIRHYCLLPANRFCALQTLELYSFLIVYNFLVQSDLIYIFPL